MCASTLPLELLLQVFGRLDARSFFAARRVCTWWHLASMEPVTLRRLLETLPMSPPVNRENLSPSELQCLSVQASRTLMLEYVARKGPEQDILQVCLPANVPAGAMLFSLAAEAQRMAMFDGRHIRLFDTSVDQWTLLAQRPLEQRLGKGLWLKNCPLNSCNIALASSGQLLALAFKSTIQLYDFASGLGRCVINDSVTTSSDQYITGLEFEQKDHLIRVHLNLKGRVIYLGSPPPKKDDGDSGGASFEHWTLAGGTQNKFLDSSFLLPVVEGVTSLTWLSGVQVLQPLHGGYLFAAQRHGGGQSSRYTVIHAKCIHDPATTAPRVDPSSAIEIARLESFLSSLDFGTAGFVRHEIGIWESMPSAHESFPKFCLTTDGTVLLLAEREKKQVWPSRMTELFGYRLPTAKGIARLLQEDVEKQDVMSGHTIPAIPLCLGTVKGVVKDIAVGISSENRSSHRFVVTTDETAQSWALDGI